MSTPDHRAAHHTIIWTVVAIIAVIAILVLTHATIGVVP